MLIDTQRIRAFRAVTHQYTALHETPA
jgi:hypothetical protein